MQTVNPQEGLGKLHSLVGEQVVLLPLALGEKKPLLNGWQKITFLTMKKKLVLILDLPHYRQRKLELLTFLLRRHSINREDWVHTYCFSGTKESLPGRKKDRLQEILPDLRKAEEFIRLNQPCVVVGFGSLPCEFLTGAGVLSTKAGTWWDTKKFGRVWITHSPEAALYKPDLVVQISRTIRRAAEQAGIETKPADIPMFKWVEYETGRPC
jgi:hypothetical protein